MPTSTSTRLRTAACGAVLLGALGSAPAALANDPLGACCFDTGVCEELQAVQCEEQDASFIGEGTSCEEIDCAAPVAAPVLSIAGLVAALGALAGLGVRRLLAARRV